MKRFKRVALVLLSVLTVGCSVVGLSACGENLSDLISVGGTIKETLPAPNGLRIEDGCLCWNPVEFASGYTVSIDGNEELVKDYKYPISDVKDGAHTFKVKAMGNNLVYLTSGWSEILEKELVSGSVSNKMTYGDFEKSNENESYLGYGFDVINSSIFSDKYVKMSFPIFDVDELMNQRLLKVDSKQTYVEEIKSSSMETFMQEWNANAHVNVGWGGKRYGGSVDVNAKYSGGVENAKSVYYHSMSFYNQEFYLVMQSDLNTYRSILSDGFITDLYSDMSPAELFNKYGTHFITSAVMGGRINSYYLYSSEEKKSYHDVSAKVSVEVRAWKTGVNVDVSGGYMQEAMNQNIYIENMLEVIGGDDFGMISDTKIAENYGAWEKSLDAYAALMGIKDTGSLVPLWNLIDASKDTKLYTFTTIEGKEVQGNRAQQLQAYFEKYGVDEYNNLMKSSGLPEMITPTSIDDVRVNNELPKNGEYEVYAGVNNDITFTVSPENAVGYTKAASLTENSIYVSIDNKNGLSLSILPSCPHNTVLQVVLSAGSVRKTITVRVVKRYTVTFESNGGTEIESLQNIRHGSQIDSPEQPIKEGYVFKGWYRDPNFAEESLYKFGASAVMDNFTLYAKWERYYPTITLAHNVLGCEKTTDHVEFGKTYAQPTDLTMESHEVKGFYVNAEMTVPFDFTQAIKTDTTIYVKWALKQFTVTFDSMGGTEVEAAENVVWGTKVKEPAQPEREGYIFEGWYTNTDFAESAKYVFEVNEVKSNFKLYAKWERYYPTIIFVHNVEGATFLKDSVEYNKPYVNPGVLTLEGHNFVGYYRDVEMLVAFDFTQAIKTETTIYVKWTPKQYTVTFDSMGGSAIAPIESVEWNTKISQPNVPAKMGYVFGGWYKDAECANVFDFQQDVIRDNTTLYAYWMEDPITIVFECNNGEKVDDRMILKGQALGNNLPTLERNYYTFGGWYTSNECKPEEKVYSYTVFNDNTVLYAKWDKDTYTITYNAGDGELSGIYTTDYQENDTITLASADREYYTLGGWYTDSGLTKAVDTSALSKAPQNITLYAKWNKNTYTITYNANAGTLSGSYTKTYQLGNTITLAGASRSYYTFGGWYTDSGLTKAVDTSALSKAPQDITLYAKWNKITYTITYTKNGGTLTGTYTTKYQVNDTITVPTANKTGYTFGGWYTDSGLTKAVDTSALSKAPQHITLYAKWTGITNSYSISTTALSCQYNGNYNYDTPDTNANNYHYSHNFELGKFRLVNCYQSGSNYLITQSNGASLYFRMNYDAANLPLQDTMTSRKICSDTLTAKLYNMPYDLGEQTVGYGILAVKIAYDDGTQETFMYKDFLKDAKKNGDLFICNVKKACTVSIALCYEVQMWAPGFMGISDDYFMNWRINQTVRFK